MQVLPKVIRKLKINPELLVESSQRFCLKHGFYDGGFDSCAECERIRDAVNRSDPMRVDNEKIRQLKIRSLIPKRFVDKRFDNYQALSDAQDKALRICVAYAERFSERFEQGSSLVMCGRPGTGKTHLACAVANHLIHECGLSPVFMTVIEAIRKVKNTYGTSVSEQSVLDAFCNPALLILDEVGVQFGTDTEKNILFEIINNRYKDLKPTILISNLSVKELTNYVGERVIDRMRDNGAVIGFDWDSYRKLA